MQIISINLGSPKLVDWGSEPFTTSINKHPVNGPAHIHTLGIEGDFQSDKSCHGGTEMALCFFPHEHYGPISAFIQRPLPIPSFGENLTTLGMLETEVCVGDTFRFGSTVAQVSKPRGPCSTLAKKHGCAGLVAEIIRTGFTGWYARILQPGAATSGDALELLDHPHPDLTVERAARAMYSREIDPVLCEAFAACPALSPDWRRRLSHRAARTRVAAAPHDD